MIEYDDYLAQLPLGESLNKTRIERHPLFISFNDSAHWNVAYFKINESDACAVVTSDQFEDVKLEKSIGPYTLRLVYLMSSRSAVHVPETVWSLYGAENWGNQYDSPFVFEDADSMAFMAGKGNPYFTFVELSRNVYWLCSADGKDLIYGIMDGNVDSKLKGVETIHSIRQLHHGLDAAKITSLSIPASVEKVKRIDGDFTDVTFEGVLPMFSAEALHHAKFDSVRVLTPSDRSPRESVAVLKRRRFEENLLFATHELTDATPKSKGYIALTNACFESDGQTLLVNTPWIATISPRTFMRSDGVVNGSVVLIGLKEGRQENGVAYDVYESPEIIDEKIAAVQSEQSQQLP